MKKQFVLAAVVLATAFTFVSCGKKAETENTEATADTTAVEAAPVADTTAVDTAAAATPAADTTAAAPAH